MLFHILNEKINEPVKHVLDFLSVGAVVAALLQWVPAATAVLAFVWTSMRVFESYQQIKINNKKLREE